LVWEYKILFGENPKLNFLILDFPWLKSRKIRSLIFEKENTKKHKAPGKQNENAEKEQNL
jgi:hypothetical protein